MATTRTRFQSHLGRSHTIESTSLTAMRSCSGESHRSQRHRSPHWGNCDPYRRPFPGVSDAQNPSDLQHTISDLSFQLLLESNTQPRDFRKIELLQQELTRKEKEFLLSKLNAKISALFQHSLSARSLKELEICLVQARWKRWSKSIPAIPIFCCCSGKSRKWYKENWRCDHTKRPSNNNVLSGGYHVFDQACMEVF